MHETVTDAPKRSSLLKAVRIASAVLGTLGLLYLAQRYLSIDVLKDSLRTLHPAPLIASSFLYVAVSLLRGYRFILLGANLSLLEAFGIASVHNALLRVMPLRSGELSVGLMLKRMGKGGFGQGLFAVLILRLIDFALVMILAAVSLSTYLKWSAGIRSAMIVGLSAALVIFVFFVSTPIAKALDRFIASRGETSRSALWVRALGALAAILKLSFQKRLLLLLSSLFLWGLILIWFYLLMSGMGTIISVSDGFSVSMLGIVGSMLPLSLIGSFGPMEGGFAVGFAAVGFSPDIAASFSVILSTFTFIQSWILAIPAGVWVMGAVSKKPR